MITPMIYRRMCFFFFFFLLKFKVTIPNFKIIFLFIDISTSVLIPLIIYLFFWTFYKILMCFQFHYLIFIYNIFFQIFSFILLLFLVFLLNWFFFSISSFNKKIISCLFFYFNFDAHFLIVIFFWFWIPFYIFFFNFIFNIWLVENCVSWFFQMRCFCSNDPGYEFEKLTLVNIVFVDLFFILFCHSTLFFLYIKKASFVIFSIFFYIGLSWYHDLGHEFDRLTWFGPNIFMRPFFLLNETLFFFIIQNPVLL